MERYPPLYREAERAREYFRERGGIEKDMVDEAEKQDAAARLIILDNKVGAAFEASTEGRKRRFLWRRM